MPERDLDLLLDAADAAGNIARRYFRQVLDIRDKGDGQGPVTQADLEIDEMLRHELLAARPDYGWLSEETEDDMARLEAEHVFIIDPIDGTRAFIDGQSSFSHSLAIARNGEITAAVVFLPIREACYAASLGEGATLNGAALTVSDQEEVSGADVLAGGFNLNAQHWQGGAPPPFTRHFRPSLAYRMALVAEGRFDAMLTLRPTWEWDVAAGTLLVTEATGATLTGLSTAPRFNSPSSRLPGLIAGTKVLTDQLHAALAPRASDGTSRLEPVRPSA